MEGKAGFQAILSDPSLEAVVLVLPPNIALQVCPGQPGWPHLPACLCHRLHELELVVPLDTCFQVQVKYGSCHGLSCRERTYPSHSLFVSRALSSHTQTTKPQGRAQHVSLSFLNSICTFESR